MDTKATFEVFRGWWFALEQNELRLNVAAGWGFKIWLASRAAIEIELPNPEEYLCNGSAEAALIDVCSAITSHGIRIKGKTE